MNNQKIWGMEYNLVLLIGWLLPLILNIPGLIITILMRSYFKNTEKINYLTDGFTIISNVNITIFVLAILLGIAAGISSIVPILGVFTLIGASVLGLMLLVYWFYVAIKGANEATKGIIYKPVLTFIFIK